MGDRVASPKTYAKLRKCLTELSDLDAANDRLAHNGRSAPLGIDFGASGARAVEIDESGAARAEGRTSMSELELIAETL